MAQSKEHKEIFKEARERFARGMAWEEVARKHFLGDYKFANGDPDNGYQWESKERDARTGADRPCLTVNKVRQHNFNIINEARQNKPGIKFMATGNGATFEAAQMWISLSRHLEYASNASDAYDTATGFMVQGGWGYCRMFTEYESEKSFRQTLKIGRVPDPFKVLLDCDAQERDKSDSRWGFIFEDFDRKEFERRFPEFKDEIGQNGITANEWVEADSVRVAEYFRIVQREDVLWEKTGEDGKVILIFESELPKDLLKEYKEDSLHTRSRDVKRETVEWKYIVGDCVAEEKVWPGKYIPIVPFIAEETVIENRMDRKSHTRALKDPQRIYNWYTSSAVEYGALQTKTPWIAPAEAIEGIEVQWNTANTHNRSVLTYRAFDENGQQLPPPTRIPPPVSAPLALEGAELASKEMAMVSGQYDSQMGAPSNERSGKAITERQRMGDRSTYHYIDATAVAIRFIGKIILDTIPRLYDSAQVLAILAEDGQPMEVKLDPGAQKAFEQHQDENGQIVARIFNPAIGQYDVQADVGPGYATRREETFNAMVLLLTQAPQLAGVIGDLLFRSGDFLYADEAAQRLRRMIPPQALGQGPTQNEQMLQQQLGQLKQLLSKTMEEYAGARLKLKGRDEKRDIDIYNAFTTRLKVLNDGQLSGQQHALAVTQLLHDIMSENLDATETKVHQDEGIADRTSTGQLPLPFPPQTPPLHGAQQAPDGKWYVKDPMRPGKYLKVLPPQEQGSPQMGPQGGMNNA